jgi:hypothetical protein
VRPPERTVRAGMNLSGSRLWVLLAGLGLVAGCSPKIGDKCTVSTDCSVQGDRLCDPTQPGGYCTIFNCEPNKCPDEAVCVAFNEASCSSPALSARFQRTFCMFVCESDGDCRDGYRCLDTTNDPARQVVDVNPQSRRICAVPNPSGMAAPMPMSTPDPAVCQIPDGGAPAEAGPPAEAGSDAGAEGSTEDAAPEPSVDAPADAASEPPAAEDASPDAAD